MHFVPRATKSLVWMLITSHHYPLEDPRAEIMNLKNWKANGSQGNQETKTQQRAFHFTGESVDLLFIQTSRSS